MTADIHDWEFLNKEKLVRAWAETLMNSRCKFDDVPDDLKPRVRELCKIDLTKRVLPMKNYVWDYEPNDR